MIGVLIQGLSMPVDCDHCHFIDDVEGSCHCVIERQCYKRHYFPGYKDTRPREKGKRAAWCPLIPIEDASIYGYPMRELLAFAIACQRNGVDEHDLHKFALNAEFALKVVADAQREQTRRWIAEQCSK